MTKRTGEILDKLDEVYTREYKCYLNHENDRTASDRYHVKRPVYGCKGKYCDQEIYFVKLSG